MTAAAPRIALIHATPLAVEPINAAFERWWPQAERFDLLEGALARDRARDTGGLAERFLALSTYASLAGAQGILYTCSAFGPEIDAARERVRLPTLKPNEAMFDEALQAGRRIALIATFEPSMAPMRAELVAMAAQRGQGIELLPCFVPGAMDALSRGDGDLHDTLIADHVAALPAVDVVMLAQFSMARARERAAGATQAPVLSSPDSAVQALRRLLGG